MTQQAGMVDKNGKIPRIGKAFLSDSLAMVEGAICGTAPLGTSVESSAGIAMGGRTGLTAVFVGILFLISMIFSPLLAVIPTTVTAPALIIVGVLMANNLKYINWDRFEVAFPAFLVWFSPWYDRLPNHHDCFQTPQRRLPNDVRSLRHLYSVLWNNEYEVEGSASRDELATEH